jgi:hypothetical protein
VPQAVDDRKTIGVIRLVAQLARIAEMSGVADGEEDEELAGAAHA